MKNTLRNQTTQILVSGTCQSTNNWFLNEMVCSVAYTETEKQIRKKFQKLESLSRPRPFLLSVYNVKKTFEK